MLDCPDQPQSALHALVAPDGVAHVAIREIHSPRGVGTILGGRPIIMITTGELRAANLA